MTNRPTDLFNRVAAKLNVTCVFDDGEKSGNRATAVLGGVVTIEYPGTGDYEDTWDVWFTATSYNYPHEPDDADVVTVGSFRAPSDALAAAMKVVLRDTIDGALEDQHFEEIGKVPDDFGPATTLA